MRWVAGLLVALCFSAVSPVRAAETGSNCPTMQMSVTVPQAGPQAEDFAAADGTVFHVSRDTLLTLRDFTTANVSLTKGRIVVNVGLSPQSSKRWMDFTARNVGKEVPFIVNGRLIKAVKIADSNLGSGFLLGPFPKAEADDLANAINKSKDSEFGCGSNRA